MQLYSYTASTVLELRKMAFSQYTLSILFYTAPPPGKKLRKLIQENCFDKRPELWMRVLQPAEGKSNLLAHYAMARSLPMFAGAIK